MSVIRYHRYIGELWEDLDLEDLVGGLSDFLLQSGFEMDAGEWDEDSLQALHDAILDALMKRGLLSDEEMQKLMGDEDSLDRFLQKVVERLVREGYLTLAVAEPKRFAVIDGQGIEDQVFARVESVLREKRIVR